MPAIVWVLVSVPIAELLATGLLEVRAANHRSMLALLRAGRAFARTDWISSVRSWWREQPAVSRDQWRESLGTARVELELDQCEGGHGQCFSARQAVEYLNGLAPRDEDGLFLDQQGCVSTEGLFDHAPLLALGGCAFREYKYLIDAADQLFYYAGHAHCAVTSLFYSSWNARAHAHDATLTAAANGWALNALVDTIQLLPMEHHRRRALGGVLTYTAFGLDAVQHDGGAWHTLLDDDTSPLNLNATALIVAGLARGLAAGHVRDVHRDSALRGWSAVRAKLNEVEASCALLAASAINELRIEDGG